MTDVTITRGIRVRDDYLTTGNIVFSSSASATTSSYTTDGDIFSHIGYFTNPNAGDAAIAYLALTGDNTAYPFILARSKIIVLDANLEVRLYAHYTDSSVTLSTIIGTAPTTGFIVAASSALPTNKTIDKIAVIIRSTATQTGTFNFSVQTDFIQLFKETLTLPDVNQPFELQQPRNLVELQILQREGGWLQDLGSPSSTLNLSGVLVDTATPNNYTALQWLQVLQGLWLEGNWQWLSSDTYNYKVQIADLRSRQVQGRSSYYEYDLRLKKYDVLSATAQTWGAIQ